MASTPPQKTAIELLANEIPFATDGLSAPVIYAEDIRGLMVVNGVVKLNLVENRVNVLTNEVVSIHVATLVVPANQARNWGRFLVDNLTDMQGVESNGEPA